MTNDTLTAPYAAHTPPKRFRRRSDVPTLAVQWNGPQDDEALKAFFIQYRKDGEHHDYINDTHYMLLKGEKIFRPMFEGHWLIYKGKLAIMDNKKFQKTYVEVDE